MSANVVAVVLEVAFGDRLGDLAARMPVWIVDSPANRAAAEALRRAFPGRSHRDGVTTFRVNPSDSPEKWLEDILPTIDLHHGEYSPSPRWTAVEAVGARLVPSLRRALTEFGLTVFEEDARGFRAWSPGAPPEGWGPRSGSR